MYRAADICRSSTEKHHITESNTHCSFVPQFSANQNVQLGPKRYLWNLILSLQYNFFLRSDRRGGKWSFSFISCTEITASYYHRSSRCLPVLQKPLLSIISKKNFETSEIDPHWTRLIQDNLARLFGDSTSSLSFFDDSTEPTTTPPPTPPPPPPTASSSSSSSSESPS